METIDELFEELFEELDSFGSQEGERGGHEGRPTLEEALRLAAPPNVSVLGGSAQASRPNGLLAGHEDMLGQLAKEIGSHSELLGTRGAGGYRNPSVVLAERLRSGEFDEMEMADYEQLHALAEELASLWEGQAAAYGMQLACNAILHRVLNDPALRRTAVASVRDWLAHDIRTL